MTSHRGKRAIALVSGGLDSVVSLAQATRDMEVRLVLFFDYGQRALASERRAVIGVSNFFGLPLREVRLDWLRELAPPGMRAADVGDSSAVANDKLDTLDAVWIPNRNGVFLNVAAAHAESYQCDFVITGFNKEEAEEFPDNSVDYVKRVNDGFELSTRNRVRVLSFTQELAKPEILRHGVELGAPLATVWSCYHAGELMCGLCGSCTRLRKALSETSEDMRPPIHFAEASVDGV